jgi:hypothetical protein
VLAFNKGYFIRSNQFISHFNQSIIQQFHKNIKTTIDETNWPKLFQGRGIMFFR